jgi:serine/threonine protein kinase
MLTRRSLYPSVFDNVDDKESTNKKAADFYKQNFSAPLDRIPSPDVALSFNAEHLLLRLLVIDPTKRADLQEIAAYPWLKSYQDILASVRKPDSIPQPQKEPELETRRSPQSSNYSTPSSRKPRLINPRSMFSQSRK